MAGSKRMSAAEKRDTILGLYHQSKSVYTEKEILTLASKAGVTTNTVADVNASLVDDGLVDKEKIGGSNYFWSFPAKKDRLAQLQHQEALEQLQQLQTANDAAKRKLEDAKRGREDDNGERPKKLARLQQLATERMQLMSELELLKENDPQSLADLQHELQLVTQAANRWTDNIWNCQAFLKKKGMDKKDINKFLGITDAFDYPQDKIPK